MSRERLVDGASQKSPCHTFLISLLQVQHHEELLRVRGGDLLRPRVADEHGHPLQVSHAHQHSHHHDHSPQVPDGHQQQHQHHHLLLGRQAVQGGAALHVLLQAVRGPASGRSNSNQSTFKHWTLIHNFAVPELHQLSAAEKGHKWHFMCHTEYTS